MAAICLGLNVLKARNGQTAPYQHCLQNHSGDDRDKFIREIHFYILAANPY